MPERASEINAAGQRLAREAGIGSLNSSDIGPASWSSIGDDIGYRLAARTILTA